MTYEMDIAGLKRDLPLCRVTDDLYIGAFVMFGDVELTVHCAAELLKRAPEYDYLIAPEAKAIPLLYEMARQSGAEKYFLARKGAKTLGVLGFGRIGQRVGELARAFKMDVVAYDPYLPAHVFEEQHAKSLSIDEVLKVSDYVTIHMPLTDETRNLFNAKSIAEMKDGAVVLNMARGGIVNEKDMYEALKAGKLGGYGSDVMENELAAGGLTEGAGFDSPLFECDNFIVTPHLGAQTVDASRDIGAHIIAKVKEALDLK